MKILNLKMKFTWSVIYFNTHKTFSVEGSGAFL